MGGVVRLSGVVANLRQSKRKGKLLLDVEAQACLNGEHKSSLIEKARCPLHVSSRL